LIVTVQQFQTKIYNPDLFGIFFLNYFIMIIKEVRGKKPAIPADCYVAENATIVGDVSFGEKCSVWFNAVIRGDVNFISIGNKVNIQDGAVIHCTYLKHPTIIGNNVSIGHNAIVHGCTIHDNVLVGMGAIIMDGCVVESNSIIGAGSVVTQNTHVESGFIYAGIPAKKVKALNASDFAGEIDRISNNYIMYSSWFKED
jgi:carbonic anhydrase/acetyltransferase-like protein (isoleucine patch superfamily)